MLTMPSGNRTTLPPMPPAHAGDDRWLGEPASEPFVPGAAARRTRSPLHALISVTRPRQRVKNTLVIAAPGAAGVLTRDDVPQRVAIAFVAFCLLAAGTYVINDVRDRHEDRLHPRKRFRPVAAGEIDPRAGVVYGLTLMLAGLGLCLTVRPLLVAVGAGYLASTFSYTLLWRRIAVLDVIAIACGFVLRAVAGGVAAPVTLSRWFMLVVTFAAVFIAAGKRQSELRRGGDGSQATRRVLGVYTAGRLRVMLLGSAIGAFIAYCIWAIQVPDVHGIPWRPLTIIPFAACLVRYGLVLRAGGGEAPEELLLRDRWLQLFGGAWVVLFVLAVHAYA